MIFIFVYFKICLFPILFISDFVISDFHIINMVSAVLDAKNKNFMH